MHHVQYIIIIIIFIYDIVIYKHYGQHNEYNQRSLRPGTRILLLLPRTLRCTTGCGCWPGDRGDERVVRERVAASGEGTNRENGCNGSAGIYRRRKNFRRCPEGCEMAAAAAVAVASHNTILYYILARASSPSTFGRSVPAVLLERAR